MYVRAVEQLVAQGTRSIIDMDPIESVEHRLSMKFGTRFVLEVSFNSDISVAGPGIGVSYSGSEDGKHSFQGQSETVPRCFRIDD